jgi:hypothetical protein
MKKCQAEYRRVVGDGSIRDVWFTPHDDETLQNVESASTTGQAFAFLRKDGSVAVAGADIRLFPHREWHDDQLEKAVYDSRVGRDWIQNFGHAGTDYAACRVQPRLMHRLPCRGTCHRGFHERINCCCVLKTLLGVQLCKTFT